jgi:biopolymer transport protein ExbB/TolQ
MKKTGLLAVAVSLMLSLGAFAGEKAADAKARPQAEGKGKIRERARPDAAQTQKSLTDQLAALKQEHQAAMTELQAIKQLATKEKATETGAALDKLIARHEQEYQKKVEPMQKRLDALKKAEGKAQAKGDDKGKGGDDKGGRPKDNPRKGKRKE